MLIKNNFKNEGHWLLNEVWKNNTFSYSEEKYILNNFNKIITSTSNSYRIEELIWNKAWGSARRQLKRVNNDIRLLSSAKSAYLEEKGNASLDNAIKKVPTKYLLNESLVYERVKWRRRAKLEKSSYELLLSYNGKITKLERWWKGKLIITLENKISYKNYKSAIKLLKNYDKNTREFSYESSWLIGWLSLTCTKGPQNSI